MNKNQIILASASPRRSELLKQIGIPHHLLPVNVDESVRTDESPEDFVLRLAREKAFSGWKRSINQGWDCPALGSDTVVVLDGHILGKPRDREHGLEMMKRLSGRSHRVLTAVCLVQGERSDCRISESRVSFRELDQAEIEAYWETGEPADKAGGYAIQGIAAQFIREMEGSYSGVMGLPLFETSQLLNEFGIKTLAKK